VDNNVLIHDCIERHSATIYRDVDGWLHIPAQALCFAYLCADASGRGRQPGFDAVPDHG
jgi:hypothetical protein